VNLSAKIEECLPEKYMRILRKLARRADEANLPLYLVGGFVRDLLIGHPNLDLDFALEGDGLAFAERIMDEESIAIKRYPVFGTATLIFPGKVRVDVAMARKETYPTAGELPTVSPGKIMDDLFRRDFTLNSMAIRVNSDCFGELVDPSGGVNDLKTGVMRVHHKKSFLDDPTRVFRAIRFRTRYGFTIHPQTSRFLKEAVVSGLIEKLSAVRLKNEFIHLLEDLHPTEALLELDELGVLRRIHRRFSVRPSRKLMKKIETHTEWKGVKHWFIMILAIFYPMKLVYSLEIARRLGFTRRETESVLKLHTLKNRSDDFPDSPSGVYRFASQFAKELVLFLMAIEEDSTRKEVLKRYLTEYRLVKLKVSGHDLETLGIQEGPIYREVLDKALDAKLDRGFRSKAEELEFIRGYLGLER
jgi:tRNA nucleotidyltransferase (CCA-adding enzyme)